MRNTMEFLINPINRYGGKQDCWILFILTRELINVKTNLHVLLVLKFLRLKKNIRQNVLSAKKNILKLLDII